MSPFAARIAPPSTAALALLAILAATGAGRCAPSPPTPSLPATGLPAAEDEASLALARDRSARADAAVEALKRSLAPGHLGDPAPEAGDAYGLETLRADYADLQRRAAGYRATLGDRHPTLVGTEQVLAELKGRLIDASRKALAQARREATEAHAAADAIDQRLQVRAAAVAAPAADITGSVAPASSPDPAPAAETEGPLKPRASTNPMALPAAAAADAAAPTAHAAAAGRRAERPTSHRVSGVLLAFAAGALALLFAGMTALQLLRSVRPRLPGVSRRVEPAMGEASPALPSPEPAGGDAPVAVPVAEAAAAPVDVPVPVLATLPLPRSAGPRDVGALVAAEPRGALMAAAATLHEALRDAAPRAPEDRVTVLVAGCEGLGADDVDIAALLLAFAAAAEGWRAVILEARSPGRLRGTLVGAGTAPFLVEAGGAQRTLYRVDAGPLTIAVLPSDAGEAEEAAAAARNPETGRVQGLDGFDLVLMVGEDVRTLAPAADLVLVATPPLASPETVAAAAAPGRETGRVCVALGLERLAAAVALPSRPAARRRGISDPAQIAPVRLGLRGTIEPLRRRVGR